MGLKAVCSPSLSNLRLSKSLSQNSSLRRSWLSLGLNPGLERAGLSAAPGIKLRSQILDSRLQAAQLEPGFFRYAKLLQGVLWGVEGLQCDPQPRSPPPHTPHPSPTLPVIF